MRLLIDTNILLWLFLSNSRLDQHTQKQLGLADELYVSIVSFWEISLKQSGKGFNDLTLPDDWHAVFKQATDKYKIDILDISIADCKKIEALPFHHKDPFDRMIIAQAYTRDLAVITSDKIFHEYQVKVIS